MISKTYLTFSFMLLVAIFCLVPLTNTLPLSSETYKREDPTIAYITLCTNKNYKGHCQTNATPLDDQAHSGSNGHCVDLGGIFDGTASSIQLGGVGTPYYCSFFPTYDCQTAWDPSNNGFAPGSFFSLDADMDNLGRWEGGEFNDKIHSYRCLLGAVNG
ncbi:hypothetical protein AOQ84DRAFT_370368 [Glonium stellatum]|uniref:Uncharacterized protein n=1 Tax=Glonium stellatum TaxID=574774 RepID=A0A8E2K0C6_9PEZI|nr:hypothetical protein AOQ84DRAFT_370368 [Glonium stellatum]